MSYEDQLMDYRWIAKRDDILERDDYCCQDCLRGKDKLSKNIQLQVHHKRYISGRMAWDYSNDYLITLCDECHEKIHGIRKDNRPDRLKPSFVYGNRNFESRPVLHIRDAIIQFIESLKNAKQNL